MATAVLALLGLAVVNPDRFVAERNVDAVPPDRPARRGYLARLSADAVPALARLPADAHVRAAGIAVDWADPGRLATNLGRERARRCSPPTRG